MASPSKGPSSDNFADESAVESDVSSSESEWVVISSSEEESCRTESSSTEESSDESGKEQELKIVCAVKKDDHTEYTEDEDTCLKRGLVRYGWGNWLKILGFRNYRFHPYRSGECLRKRAEKLNLKERLKKQ